MPIFGNIIVGGYESGGLTAVRLDALKQVILRQCDDDSGLHELIYRFDAGALPNNTEWKWKLKYSEGLQRYLEVTTAMASLPDNQRIGLSHGQHIVYGKKKTE